MRLFVTVLAALSIQLLLTSAFSFRSHSWHGRSLDQSQSLNKTAKSLTQSSIMTSTSRTSANLTYSPWPPTPYDIDLPSMRYTLAIVLATRHIVRPPINILELQHFISTFADNLEEKYPPPAKAPREASSRQVDVHSYTRWTIQYYESMLGPSLPTRTILECADALNHQLRLHGPSFVDTYIYRTGGRRWWRAAGFDLIITGLGENSLNVSSVQPTFESQTS